MFKVILVSFLMVSLNAFAGPSDLVGKWMGSCAEIDGGHTISAMEFRADGTGSSQNQFFSDATCSNPVGAMDFPLTYQADGTSFVANVQADPSMLIVLKGNYTVSGDILTLTPTEASVNGQPQPVDAIPMVLKRAN
jgi:hypothetical protein